MVDINKLVSKHYLSSDTFLEMIQEQLSQTRERLLEKVAPPETEVGQARDIVLKLPIFRLSEKMWGKEGTEDRAIIENLMSKIIDKGDTLAEKVRLLSNFIQSPPQTNDISEILSHIVFLDTLTNIMVHFNASAAGFTFEGFLAAMLGGRQIGVAEGAGVQDLINNDKMPISLKLLTGEGGEGKASVEGSFRDLCDHFIDADELRQDPESGHYLGGTAGAEGYMTYVVVLKSFREKEAEKALTGDKPQVINFYQFDFNARNFLDSMRSNPNNMKLLLLPEDLADNPADDPATTHVDMDAEDLLKSLFSDYNALMAKDKKKLNKIIAKYDANYAKELFSDMATVDVPKKDGRKTLVWGETGFAPGKGIGDAPGHPLRSDAKSQLPWEPPKGDERLKAVGVVKHDAYLDVATSIRILEQALAKSPETFWGYIARTLGYVQGAAGTTQFHIARAYYSRKSYDKDGMGWIGGIPIGRVAVTNLAQQYVDVLNQEIFDLFEKVETLTNQINGYFVGGQGKKAGLAAAQTAAEVEAGTREYVKKAEEV
jgi:hypothetical protein